MRWLVLLIAMTLPIAAAAQPAPVPLGPTILDTGSQVVRVESFTLSAPGQGADYRIGVLIPRRPAPEAGFPALYLLDGQAAAELLTDEVLGALDPDTLPVIVTLGYTGDARFAGPERTRDYTPPGPDGTEVIDPRGRPGGGAPDYLTLLSDEILPRVVGMAPLDPDRSLIWGHSYAGLFVLWSASTPASPFARYVSASPSLWWDGAAYFDRAKARARAGDWPPRPLDLHKGGMERERASTPDTPDARKLVRERAAAPARAFEDLDAALRAAGIPGETTVFPGLSHGETFRASLRQVLANAARLTERPR
ncbi:hypothetical protein SAMN04488105_108202 [Salipiger thiooxidans]|uniref:Esterase n=1 Tax=Salipiger thiooxidans TaxID=282683 RepID=A0A1G7G8R2_9RHOB|nr:alpha/beta hydrolase-fold protein [Salipiger thiooxidans]SDE84429.1 hypothetical protein SAMN04488105_108202 [Salipiger thiooxidans]